MEAASITVLGLFVHADVRFILVIEKSSAVVEKRAGRLMALNDLFLN